MSLRGIESQMIVNRTNDYAKDASAQIRRGELSQEYLAQQNKVMAEMQKGQVAQMEGKESPRVLVDEQKEPDQGGTGAKKRKKAQTAAQKAAAKNDQPDVGAPTEYILDIKV